MKTTLVLLTLAGCVETQPNISGTQSLKVEIKSPDRGTAAARLMGDDRNVVIDITAYDANNEIDTSYAKTVGVYAQFLGTLSPGLDQMPIVSIPMAGGKATGKMITLPDNSYGPTSVWVDDSKDPDPTFATGASDPMWYRDPYIEDIQKPRSETALDALEHSKLELKQIDVHGSKYGANGRLVVNSVFAQGYTVSDMDCAAGGVAPCVLHPYNSVEVFSFSAPKATSDEDSGGTDLLQQGSIISRFNGGISEFNGLTEIGFPRTFADLTMPPNHALEPTPVRFQAGRTALGETDDWFDTLSSGNGIINFERYEAAPISVADAVVCALDADYDTYKQWKIDPNGTPSAGGVSCMGNKKILNVITAGATDFDPATIVGKKLPKLVGIVRPVSIGAFNVWIVYPRGIADLQLP